MAEKTPADLLGPLLAQAELTGALTETEVAVLSVRFGDGHELGWKAIAEAIGVASDNHAAQLHARAVPKLRVHLLLHHPEVFGGRSEIVRAVRRCCTAEAASGGPVLTPAETEAFRTAVLDDRRSVSGRPVSAASLRAACARVIRYLSTPL